jgi:hypothetical protein
MLLDGAPRGLCKGGHTELRDVATFELRCALRTSAPRGLNACL